MVRYLNLYAILSYTRTYICTLNTYIYKLVWHIGISLKSLISSFLLWRKKKKQQSTYTSSRTSHSQNQIDDIH